jgi:hypothetical protein
MRSFILLAVSAIALSSASMGQASAGTSAGAASLLGAADQLRITEPVARVCKQVCNDFGNVCKTKCFREDDRDQVIHERVFRDRDEHRDRDERRDRRPGLELDVPGVTIHTR